MKIVIRTNASSDIGLGHIMRCMTLANMLKQTYSKTTISFFLNEDAPSSVIQRVESENFKVQLLQGCYATMTNLQQEVESCIQLLRMKSSIDLFIVDHYGLDELWESKMLPYCKKLMVIDDLANRNHNCHILLDQNLAAHMKHRYEGLVPEDCLLVLGPTYALLRPQFYEYRNIKKQHRDCDNVLINFGGSDPTGETFKVLDAIKQLDDRYTHVKFTVVAGSSNLNASIVEEQCKLMKNVVYLNYIDNMADLLSRADLVIGAGGISIWERAIMGVPSVVICVADNQFEVINEGHKLGIHYNLGNSKDVSSEMIATVLSNFIANEKLRINMHEACTRLMSSNSNQHPILSLLDNSK